tara:strand:+ start:199 stop:603 length:405 start_codon:yes stop_codon:yes gene_type:complete
MPTFKTTLTGDIITTSIEDAAKANDQQVRIWRATRDSHFAVSFLELADPRIDAGYEGITEIPVTEDADISTLTELVAIQDYVGGGSNRVVMLATPHTDRTTGEDAGYMTHGHRVRANVAAYDATAVIGTYCLTD